LAFAVTLPFPLAFFATLAAVFFADFAIYITINQSSLRTGF
jgi:hypothetical protein